MSPSSPQHQPSTPTPSTNPLIPTTRPDTEVRLHPRIISTYQSLLSLPPRSPLIPLQIQSFPRQLLKKAPRKLPPFLQFLTPRPRKLYPHQRCELCPLHSPLKEPPLVHLTSLLAYEMYTHLQSLRAMHPSQRHCTTNALFASLHPWYEQRFLMPGTRVKGCLACALGLLYNDPAALNAIAVLTKSGRRRGEGAYPALIAEGWLGWLAEATKGVGEVRKDRNFARRMTGVRNSCWEDRGKGEVVEFREVVWREKEEKKGARSHGSVRSSGSPTTMSEGKLMGPVRPERPEGLTLWREESKVGEQHQKKRRTAPPTTTTATQHRIPKPPPIPEKSRLRDQVARSSSPLSPKSRGPRELHRSHTTNTTRAPRPDLEIPIQNDPFADPKNPFFSPSERKRRLPSSSSSSSDDSRIIGPSIIASDSESDYSEHEDRETRQRYLDEHDELLKLVQAPGMQAYVDTLPKMRWESRL
ncbi:MAG: hypothetical protein LQ338_002161 [Usnochroma carphineum]|nr:MAG: hypothetical protein LQ338_002161 [Usnochroma carphineum]